MSDRHVIETAGLWKRYDDVEALRGLDLQVPVGSIFGFLGRNGAGKTTTIKVLLGMSKPSRGEARVFGQSPFGSDTGVEVRRRTAFVSDEKDLYDYMTVGEIIAFTRSFYPRWRGDLEQQLSAHLRPVAESRHQDPLARHAHEAGDAARALPGRRAADARRAHLGPRSGDGGRDAAGARRPCRRRRVDGVLLVASARRSRADRRSRRDHRPRPDGGRRRAGRSARAVSANPAGVRRQRA